ncbi:hypothetical protein HDV05_003843 [Chytridiales sp. JEL 0842]|nr:hypothetical protein HDV05_003843 [Chytridiales sp. JEL 0842]
MATRSPFFLLALFSALLQFLQVTRSQVLTPLPQKTNVIRIGASFPYANPYVMGDVAAMTAHLSDNMGSIMIYNHAKRYIEMINADPNILPTTRIELVPMNSANDRGRALMTTLDLIQQYNVSGVIGEMYGRNTVTMAVAAAVNNVLHCVPASIAPSLSNKADFPTTFRTQVANAYQARALIGLMQYWNRTTFGVIASNDEAGNGFVTEITSFAAAANITLTRAVFADVGAQDYSEWLNILIRNRVQNIVMYVPAADGAIAFTSARKLGMFDGSYWFMVTSGLSPDFFNTEQTVPTLAQMRGTWQVDDIFINDAVNTGRNADAYNIARWYESMFLPNNATGLPLPAGYPRDFNPNWIVPFPLPPNVTLPATNCDPSDPHLVNLANQLPPFPFTRVVGNTTRTFLLAGNQCIGGGKYLQGLWPLFVSSKGFMPSTPLGFQ